MTTSSATPGPVTPISISCDMEKLKQLAEQGDADAQVRLGINYFTGQHTTKNTLEGKKWLNLATQHTDTPAGICAQGFCLMGGIDTHKDLPKAFECFLSAANKNYAPAQKFLGIFYLYGLEMKDEKIAVKWFQKAAEQGDSEAQSALGCCYQSGRGVDQNDKLAVVWFQRAAEQGSSEAQSALGCCYYYGKGVKQDYKLAVSLFQKAAEQEYVGIFNPLYYLQLCYQNGLGVTKNPEIAKEYSQLHCFIEFRYGLLHRLPKQEMTKPL